MDDINVNDLYSGICEGTSRFTVW